MDFEHEMSVPSGQNPSRHAAEPPSAHRRLMAVPWFLILQRGGFRRNPVVQED
jgi:hypothetical protein